jgi:ADP-heptose:LPS heptosyltransferase
VTGGVLVLRALGLGDLLTGVPALRAVRERWPDEPLALATPRWLWPLVRSIGVVDVALDVGGLDVPAPRLRPRVAVNLHGRGPESHRWLLSTEPAALVAFRHLDVPASGDGPAWDAGEHEVARWCRMLVGHGVPADPSRLRLAPPPPDPRADGAVVLHPGAKDAARRWPPERWAAVARALGDGGARVVVTGGSGERAIAERVASLAALPPRAVLAGRTDVWELARLVAGAALVLAGDTGVGHLATAYGRPSVLLFGPTPPAAWGPPADGPHVALWAGRTGDPHGDVLSAGLLEIAPDDVIAAIGRVAPAPLAGSTA